MLIFTQIKFSDLWIIHYNTLICGKRTNTLQISWIKSLDAVQITSNIDLKRKIKFDSTAKAVDWTIIIDLDRMRRILFAWIWSELVFSSSIKYYFNSSDAVHFFHEKRFVTESRTECESKCYKKIWKMSSRDR